MKNEGVYSSPDSRLSELSQQSLFPDVTYGLDSGGSPEVIPSLTYDRFLEFHRSCTSVQRLDLFLR